MEEAQANAETGDMGQEPADATGQEPGANHDPLALAVSRYRDLVASMPGLMSEMVQGSTLDEVDASAQVARQAYEEVARRIAAAHEAHIPPGNPARSQLDAHATTLKPEAKIALGLKGR